MLNLAAGIALGIFLLALFVLAANFVLRTIDSKAERIAGLSGKETPAILVRLGWREWRDTAGAVLFAGLIWGVIGIGVFYWLANPRKDDGLHWNTIAGFTFATIFGLGSLAAVIGFAKTIRLWFWFMLGRRVRTEAKLLFAGERTQDELDSNRTFFLLAYSYTPSAAAEGRYVIREEVSERVCKRFKSRQSVAIEYARADPKFVRRL
ncbi:MAG: hypothetical protein HW419_3140 [Deltaproteobacteria bacterium]|nr:hypothetical protein [Deltaproteobacteria bacterium]